MRQAFVSGEENKGMYIQMLGGFSVSSDGIAILDNQWKAGRARRLVKLIALTPGHKLHCEQILNALWPDLDPANAANNFYQTLYAARKTLEPLVGDCLHLKERFLSFTGGKAQTLTIDVEQFENAFAEVKKYKDTTDKKYLANEHDVAVYKNALALYSGDLLPGDLNEEWTKTRRDTQRQAYQNLLLDLARLYEKRHRFDPR
jgi:DNA-binding SARP family transcriptional activator